MCGIAGVLSQNEQDIKDTIILRMRDSIRHRGPDDQGHEILYEDGLAFIHTRLSILDLSDAAHQPMWDKSRNSVIVFNGEIYNFLDIKAELLALGCEFTSDSDTEVLIAGYQIWGTGLVEKLNGMFAFAIWDKSLKRLWLVRDRLGVKPLYYYYDQVKRILIFGSEIKAILTHPSLVKKLNPNVIKSYLTLGYIPGADTIFSGIKKIAPGHWMLVDHNLEPTIERYWDISRVGSLSNASYGRLKTEVRSLLFESVSRRLVSDVPVAALLSGGVDSTLTVGIMSNLQVEKVRTFSTAFDVGPRSFKYNIDADYAEKVSKKFDTQHTRIQIKPGEDLITILRRAVRAMDEPHGNPTFITTMLLAEHIKKQGISVVISGDGSDEIFGGYSRYQNDCVVSFFEKIPFLIRNFLIFVIEKFAPSSVIVKILNRAKLTKFTADRIISWWHVFSPKMLDEFLTKEFKSINSGPELIFKSAIDNLDSKASMDNRDVMLYTDLKLWIAEENNMRMDKAMMSVGVENRAPFLDYKLVEYAMAIPFSIKAGWRKEKRLLKEAFFDYLPAYVNKRKKWGWHSPLYYWLKDDMWLEACALIKKLPDTGIFTPEVNRLIEVYPPKNPQQIWLLVIFAIWYEEYIK